MTGPREDKAAAALLSAETHIEEVHLHQIVLYPSFNATL